MNFITDTTSTPLVNNNLKANYIFWHRVGLASSWPGIELARHRVGGIESAASSRRHQVGGIEAYPTRFETCLETSIFGLHQKIV